MYICESGAAENLSPSVFYYPIYKAAREKYYPDFFLINFPLESPNCPIELDMASFISPVSLGAVILHSGYTIVFFLWMIHSDFYLFHCT